MPADITEGRRTEQRIDDAVRDDIRVGMTEQPPLKGNLHPAEDQRTAFHQSVNIVAVPDPHHCASPCSIASASSRSSSVVSLIFHSSPREKATGAPIASMSWQSSVYSSRAAS